jgi:branched-chain amino acid transport system substrate-binding protein
MYEDGVRYVIPVVRGDAWDEGLRDAAELKFENLGGTFLEGITYAPTLAEFSTEASDLNDKVLSAVDMYDADQVAVLHISFEEVTLLFTACLDYDALGTVAWYGSDGTAVSGAMLDDSDVAAFAVQVGYPCTIFAPAPVGVKWAALREHGMQELGRELDSYSYAIYDIVWAYAYSLMLVDTYDADAVAAVLPTVTESLFGASGFVQLDEAGDRKAGDYGIWTIQEPSPGTFEWVLSGTYILSTDSVTWN